MDFGGVILGFHSFSLLATENILYAMDYKLQTDVKLLNFQKALDIVTHQWLLSKLSSYGIQYHIYFWINYWFTQMKQWVIVDSSTSVWTLV